MTVVRKSLAALGTTIIGTFYVWPSESTTRREWWRRRRVDYPTHSLRESGSSPYPYPYPYSSSLRASIHRPLGSV